MVIDTENAVRILFVEDSSSYVQLTRGMLKLAMSGEFQLECVDSLAAGRKRLSKGGIDVVLLDLNLPDSEGIDTFTRIHEVAEGVPIVIYTSVDDEELSLAALNQGAADYLVKGEVNAKWLAKSLVYAIQRSRVSRSASVPREPADSAVDELVDIDQADDSEATWVVTFHESRLINATNLQRICDRLLDLMDRSDCAEVRLKFSNVEYVTNAAIATLLTLMRYSKDTRTRLVLFQVSPQVREQFSSRRIDKLFRIEST